MAATIAKNLSLGVRFALASAAIVVATVGAAVAVTALLGQGIADQAVRRTLERSANVEDDFQEKSLNQQRLVAQLFASDVSFAAYIGDAVANNDPVSIIDQLEQRQEELGFDIALVLDPDGRAVARTDGVTEDFEDLSTDPMVVEALNNYVASGVWVSRGRLFYVAAVPVGAGGLLQGFLIAGVEIDREVALELQNISDTEVTFLLAAERPIPVASTLDRGLVEELEDLLAARPELAGSGPEEVTLGGEQYFALVRPLYGSVNTEDPDETVTVGSVVSLASLDEQLAPYRRIRSTLLGVGLVAVLLAVAASFVLPRSILEPLSSLSRVAKAAAAGDYDQRVEVDRNDEVGQLAEAFDTLLADLREKRDMEIYITELAKNVPEEEELVTEVFQADMLRASRLGTAEALPGDTTRQLTETAPVAGRPLAADPFPNLAQSSAGSRVSPPDPFPTLAQSSVTSQPPAGLGQAGQSTLSGIGAGSRLGGRFKILSELGAGGMGVVYKARDDSLNELVALKMLKTTVFDDAERLDALKEELKIARRISHPNVLRTFDFGELEGVPFISMEYVRGITLRQLLDRSGQLPLSAGLRLARQLCRGLAAAHSDGVLHRDIKPENLIVEHTGNAKLMDFGIAQRISRRSSQESDGSIVGTPFYLAPEQLESKEADERSDLYACGVVFYELFTGQLPYPSTGNLIQLIQLKMKEEPTPPRQHWETMPVGLERIIMRCMERDPANRYNDVAILLEELENLRA